MTGRKETTAEKKMKDTVLTVLKQMTGIDGNDCEGEGDFLQILASKLVPLMKQSMQEAVEVAVTNAIPQQHQELSAPPPTPPAVPAIVRYSEAARNPAIVETVKK